MSADYISRLCVYACRNTENHDCACPDRSDKKRLVCEKFVGKFINYGNKQYHKKTAEAGKKHFREMKFPYRTFFLSFYFFEIGFFIHNIFNTAFCIELLRILKYGGRTETEKAGLLTK